jgi:hypothetical protein
MKYEPVRGVLEGEIPRQKASVYAVTHELGYEGIRTKYMSYYIAPQQ